MKARIFIWAPHRRQVRGPASYDEADLAAAIAASIAGMPLGTTFVERASRVHRDGDGKTQ